MNYLNPKEMTTAFAASAQYKSGLKISKFALIAILGGAYIAFGGLLTVMVAGGMPGIGAANPGIVKFVAGALFPVGLILVSVTGADLFTSDCAAFTLPFFRKEMRLTVFVRILILSYIFNFIGAQLIAWFMTAQTGLVDYDPWKAYLHTYSEAKMNLGFGTVLLKGIGANWLVCLGMFMGYAAKDITGKCIGIWIPVMIFVTLGYEHSIANMFFIPAAIYSGADILWSEFLINNLLPATLGNLIGGAVLVGCVYGYLNLTRNE